MQIVATGYSVKCEGQSSCQPARYARALPTYGTTRLLALREEPIEHRSAVSRLKALCVKGCRSLATALAIDPIAPRKIQAARWLAGGCPFDGEVYKELIAERGVLNTLYLGLVNLKIHGREELSGQAKAFLEQNIKGVTALDWAVGGLFAVQKVRSKKMQGDLGDELRQWINTARAFISGADLRAIKRAKNLPWLGPDNTPQKFRALLANLQARAKSGSSTAAAASCLLARDYQDIAITDWAADQGVARMWFNYASGADEDSIAKALGRWMNSALELMEQPWAGAGGSQNSDQS